MNDTTFAAGRIGSVLGFAGHESPVHAVRNACHDVAEHNDDSKLMEAVAVALRATGHPALRRLDIEICGGVVVLWGRVSSYYQKQVAQEVAQRVGGVRGIANGIEVICCR